MKRKLLIALLGLSVALTVPVRAETCESLVQSYLAQDYLETIGADEVPEEIAETTEKYGEEYGIAPELITAIIWKESTFKPDADGGACLGLMQINPKVHADRMKRLKVKDIFDIDGNIHVGSDYLAELFEQHEDPAIVLMKFNGDSSSLKKGIVSKYAEKILKVAECYERVNGK